MIRAWIVCAVAFLAMGCELLGYSPPTPIYYGGYSVRLIYTWPDKPQLWPAQKPGSLVWRLEGGVMVPLAAGTPVSPSDTVVEYQGFCIRLLNGRCKAGYSHFYGVATAANFDPSACGGVGGFYSTDTLSGGFGPHVNADGVQDGVITACSQGYFSDLHVLPGVPEGVTIPAPPVSALDDNP